MKKLLFAVALVCAALLSGAGLAQVPLAYQDTINNKVVVIPVTPAKPLPTTAAITGGATELTLGSLLTETQSFHADSITPPSSIPPIAPAPKGDGTYTRDFKNISTATDTVLISATSSQTGRLHRLFCTIDAADTLILKDGSTAVSGTFRFPSSGGVLDWPLDPYAYAETTANTALNLTTSTTANVNCSFRYKKD